MSSSTRWTIPICVAAAAAALAAAAGTAAGQDKQQIVLRAYGVPEIARNDIESLAERRIIEEFQNRFPHVRPVPTSGLVIPGRSTMDILPLMQIAGDIAPDVMYVNFRQSDTYVRNKFLYPLDDYLEQLAGVKTIPGRHLMELDDYVARLKAGPHYEAQFAERVPRQCWNVMRRQCPYKEACPYVKGPGPCPPKHEHVWCFPVGPDFIALFYRKDLFYEAGLPDRVPETVPEMLEWARKLTWPKEDRYGLQIGREELGWSTMSFLYSEGGRVVEEDGSGDWRCCFDTEPAVEAYYQVARFFLEPFTNKHGKFTGVVYLDEPQTSGEIKSGMFFGYLDQRFFAQYDPSQYGFGPVPKGATGLRGSEFNSRMVGIYAGLEDQPARRDAAWEYIRFIDGPEARRIQATTMLENGLGKFVRPKMLVDVGYPEYVRQVPKGWEEAAETAMSTGIPEPYGRNCQTVYTYVSKAINTIQADKAVLAAIERSVDPNVPAAGQAAAREQAKARIREILQDRVRRSNEKMLDILTPQQRSFRNSVALVVAICIFVLFAWVFHRVFKVFAVAQTLEGGPPRKGWQLARYKWAYLLLAPAIGTILLWQYWPLARGTLIAFQDYNVRGFTEWVGMGNFATVLFDEEFWYAMWVAIQYALLYMVFGFAAPIVLAFLLTEVPKGKILYRTIYYLPAVLTGVVVIFLWHGFYGRYGMINKVINGVTWVLNLLPGVSLGETSIAWLENPTFALLFCLIPTIWSGMGPGCLIYLAALKTIPEESYEAADIDGAGLWAKAWHIAIPGIKALVIINFIGAMIGAMQNGGQFILAMTGGGPYTPYGRTEVVGLHIFWEAFMFLRFGPATAMAWVLGAMLIGFTVVQLQKLSRLEFRAAKGTGE
jgi:ABC-type sugar transport system permease subunit/ABC-type glycerol-3-phosphate transport system substrate-binding protein